MYVVFLAGGIASGKSTVARELERLGAWCVDLDQISRDVLEPGTPTVHDLADAFGADILDPETGAVRRNVLAARAFATRESAALLEAIELPAIRKRLADVLTSGACAEFEPECCVVEIPLLDRMVDSFGLADEIVLVYAPLDQRRIQAVGRGMDAADFDARAANQPSDAWLLEHVDTVIRNDGSLDDLLAATAAWWASRVREGWRPREGRVSHGA